MTSSPSEPVVEPVVPAQPTTATAEITPAQAKSGGGVVLASLALFLSIAAVGAIATTPLWSPESKRQKALNASVDGRVAALETRLGAAASGAPLSDRIAALEVSLGALDKKVASLPDAKAVGALAMAELRDALDGSDPFAAELVAVRASGIADEGLAKILDRLTPYAATGVPTFEQLAARFVATAPDVLAADLRTARAAAAKAAEEKAAAAATAQPPAATEPSAADGAATVDVSGLSTQLWSLVSSAAEIVRLTAFGAAEGGSAIGIVEKAGGLVIGGDLVAAVEVLATLEADAAEAAKPWIADARARVAADQASALMAQRAASLLPPKS